MAKEVARWSCFSASEKWHWICRGRSVSSRTMVLLGLIKGAAEAGATRIRALHLKKARQTSDSLKIIF